MKNHLSEIFSKAISALNIYIKVAYLSKLLDTLDSFFKLTVRVNIRVVKISMDIYPVVS
jgi:hypothetical protein